MPLSLPSLVSDLADAFPREKIPPNTVAVYIRELSDLPLDELAEAVSDVIRTDQWFPRVADLRQRVAERRLALPSEAEALEQISARTEWARLDDDMRGEPPVIHPAVLRALRLVGGAHAFKAADEPTVVRGQLLRLYREIRADEIAAVVRPQLPAGPERKQLSA